MIIYVSNLAPETTQLELRKVFQAHGEVSSVSLPSTQMRDGRGTGSGRGIGFVVMPDKVQARAALAALNLRELRGRAMTVQVARASRSTRDRG
jgi:RNA recognition motif-containing protein